MWGGRKRTKPGAKSISVLIKGLSLTGTDLSISESSFLHL